MAAVTALGPDKSAWRVEDWSQYNKHTVGSDPLTFDSIKTVVVGGRLRFREYDAADGGGRRQAYEIEASSVGPDLSRYVGTFGKPMRELPDDAEVPVVPAQQSEPVDDPWAAPVGAVAEETAA